MDDSKKPLFYSICIPFRILYAALTAFLLYKYPSISPLALAFINLIFAIVLLAWQSRTWWVKEVHGGFMLATTFFCLTYYFKLTPFYIPALLLIVDTLFGLVSSVLRNPIYE
jgi:hypothetical protein